MNYEAIILEAFQEARRAVQRVNRRGVAKRPLGVGASGDLTYEIDRVVETSILKVFQKRFPKFFAVTEESGALGSPKDRPIVLIDPVDGSTNASHSIPLYSSSIAIADGERFEDILVAGVIDLVHDDVIIGGKGKGVFCNGRPISPSHVNDLQGAVISIDVRMKRGLPKIEEGVRALLTSIRHPRVLGSAALETAYVAIGRVDAFIQPLQRLRSYDCLPALYLVKEAGGSFKLLGRSSMDLNLRETRRRFAYVAAGNEMLCNTILSFFE